MDSCTSSLKVVVPKYIISDNSFAWIQTEKFLAKPEITTSIKLKSNVLDHNFQTTLRKDLELVKAFGKIIFANFFVSMENRHTERRSRLASSRTRNSFDRSCVL